MDALQATIYFLNSFVVFVMATGCLLTAVNLHKPIIDSTMPMYNIVAAAIYVLLSIYSTADLRIGTLYCIVFLWAPFIFTAVLGNIYVIKCWRLYVLTMTGTMRLSEFDENHDYLPKIPDSLDDKVILDVDLESKAKVRNQSERSCLASFDSWVYLRPWLASTNFIVKIFAVLFAVEMVIILALNLTLPQYEDPTSLCNQRTKEEMILFICMTSFYALIYCITIVKIWKIPLWFGLRTQLSISAIAWLIVLATFIGMAASPTGPILYQAFVVIKTVIWLFPFSADIVWPLIKHETSKRKKREKYPDLQTMNVADILRVKTGKHGEIGWEAIASYMSEHLNPVDLEGDAFLLHSIFFVKDYIQKKNELVNMYDIKLLDPTEQLDSELCGLVVVSWMKYLHKTGELVWDSEEDKDAIFLMSHPEIEVVRKEIEQGVQKFVNTTSFFLLSAEDQRLAGKKLRELFRTVSEKLEKEVMVSFRKSIQYEELAKKWINQ